MRDYYDILGIKRGASEQQIKSTYRKLARKYHPDVNPADRSAEERFKEISEAYDVLSDKKKRQQYDRVGHRAWKAGFKEAPPSHGSGQGDFWWQAPGAGFPGAENVRFYTNTGSGGFGTGRTQGFADLDLEDLFGGLFGKKGRRRAGPMRGEDSLSRLAIPMEVAVLGGERNLFIISPEGKRESLAVKIPRGIREGQKIRLAGKGNPGTRGAPPGDLLIEIVYEPDSRFHRDGDDLTVDVKVPFSVAVLGGSVQVPTLEGSAELKIPPATQGGQRLRLKEKGLPKKSDGRGNLFVRVRVMVPKNLDSEGRKLVERLKRYE